MFSDPGRTDRTLCCWESCIVLPFPALGLYCDDTFRGVSRFGCGDNGRLRIYVILGTLKNAAMKRIPL